MSYKTFLAEKAQLGGNHGFEPVWMPDFLFDFQRTLVDWSVRRGRAAIFADCGLGKTPTQLAWAENVVRKTNGRVLILTPLAVGLQTVKEAEKFGIEAARSSGALPTSKIVVTNYERLHHFNPDDFEGVVCDESSILKNFDGVTKAAVTEFLRTRKYRLLCTATAAPNDYVELGTSSEAIGEMGHLDMLGMFFKNNQGTIRPMARRAGANSRQLEEGAKWRFRGHAEPKFWRWVCSWARAIRKPSDIGGSDERFALPPLEIVEHVVAALTKNEDFLFDMPAVGLSEQRDERRRTLTERCERAAELIVSQDSPSAAAWCHLNDEGDLLEKLIPNCTQISGDDSDDEKEEKLVAFASGQIRRMVTKPQLAGFGLNWQHCSHQTFFPSHSFEQWYQAVRRSWRFGQKCPVRVDVISSEGESGVVKNLQRKAAAAEAMFANLVSLMRNELSVQKTDKFKTKTELPSWLS